MASVESPKAKVINCDIAVVGGGLGGLALAVGLQARGYDFQLFEAAPELRTATGTLLASGGNAFTALDGLLPGLVNELKQRGCPVTTNTSYTRYTKEGEVQVVTSPMFMETVSVKWSTTQNVLSKKLDRARVHCGYRTTGFTEEDDCVKVHFKDQPDVRARLLIGADGLRSAIRAVLVPQDSGPRWLGQMNWNAVIDNNTTTDAWPAANEIQAHGNQPFFSNNFATIICFMTDIGKGRTFWQVRVAYEKPEFTDAPDTASPAAAAWSKEDLLTKVIAGHPESDADVKQQNWGGLGKPGSKARVLDLVAQHGLERVYQLVQATPENKIFERGMYDRVPLDELKASMVSAGGRVVLLGDAAHAMHSGPGMGARMAFEDAHTLVEMLDQHRDQLLGWAGVEHLATPPDGKDLTTLQTVSSAYNAARLVRTCRVQRASAESAGLSTIREAVRPPGLTEEARRQRAKELFAWLYKYPKCLTGDPDSQYYPPVEEIKV